MGATRQLWDAAKHPRGPGGKFVSVGGGTSAPKKTARQVFASADHAALHKHTVPQLRERAKTAGLQGHSRSRKADLVDALVAHKASPGAARSAREKMSAKLRPAKTASSPAVRSGKSRTWEELGKPKGPSPVGQVIGHMGGTYERLPGEPRQYRVITADGRDISGRLNAAAGHHRTAEDARTALRMDAFDQERTAADKGSAWRKALGQVSGSWSYDTDDIKGFDAATPDQRDAIRQALHNWAIDKINTADTIRGAEPRVNTAIRNPASHSDRADKDIRALDLALSMSKTKRPITVYRGYSAGSHILPADWKTRDLKGLEWSSGGFTPTSAEKDAAESYVGFPAERGFAIRLKLPTGSSAIAIEDAIGGLDNEGEIVLPRGLKFRVVKDMGAQGDYGTRWLDVEVVKAPTRKRPTAGAQKAAPANQRSARSLMSL